MEGFAWIQRSFGRTAAVCCVMVSMPMASILTDEITNSNHHNDGRGMAERIRRADNPAAGRRQEEAANATVVRSKERDGSGRDDPAAGRRQEEAANATVVRSKERDGSGRDDPAAGRRQEEAANATVARRKERNGSGKEAGCGDLWSEAGECSVHGSDWYCCRRRARRYCDAHCWRRGCAEIGGSAAGYRCRPSPAD